MYAIDDAVFIARLSFSTEPRSITPCVLNRTTELTATAPQHCITPRDQRGKTEKRAGASKHAFECVRVRSRPRKTTMQAMG